MNQRLKFIYFLIFTSFLLSCSENKKNDKKDSLVQIVTNSNSIQNDIKAELYCWCLNSISILKNGEKDSTYISSCTTTIAIKPKHLIKKEHLFYSTQASSITKLISETLLNGARTNLKVPENIDTRFVMAIFQNKSEPDLFVFKNNYEMLFNDTVNYKYSFPIIDSILKIIGKESLLCPSNN